MKKICTIYSNCQGNPLKSIMETQPSFAAEYDIEHFMITDMFMSLSLQYESFITRLKKTDLFIYQKIRSDSMTVDRYEKEGFIPSAIKPTFYTDYIISQLLPDTCKLISFPNLYFEGYHVDNFTVHEQWKSVVKFPSGNKTIKTLIEQSSKKLGESDIDLIIEHLNSPDLFTPLEIDTKCTESIKKLQKKESDCDVKIADLILENFKKYYLFYTPNHPSKFILRDVVGKMLIIAGHEFDPSLVFDIDWFNHSQIPIYPCVINHYQLNFWGDQEPMYNIRIGSSRNVTWNRCYRVTHDDYWTLFIAIVFNDCICKEHSFRT